MKHTFRVLFFLKRDKQKANGNLPIFCRITVNKQEARFNLKVDVNPLLWDVKTGKAAGRSKEAIEINAVVDKTKSVLFNIYNNFLLNEENITAEKIKNHFLGDAITRHYLLEEFLRHNEDVEKLIGINKSKATYQKYECARKHLTNFIKEKYNLSDISFKEINHLFISDFEVYLLTTCRCNSNTTAKFIQLFKRIVLIARNNGWIYHDPFTNYKITIKKVDRDYLTQEELDSIMEKKMPNKRLEQIKDVFTFACYTGIVDKMRRKEKEGNSLLVKDKCLLVALSAE